MHMHMHMKLNKKRTINASNFDECLFNGQFTIGNRRERDRKREKAVRKRRGKINKENGLHTNF